MANDPVRIVIVDDDTGIRSVVRAAVESTGHEALEATTARHALELIPRQRPQLIIGIGISVGAGGK